MPALRSLATEPAVALVAALGVAFASAATPAQSAPPADAARATAGSAASEPAAPAEVGKGRMDYFTHSSTLLNDALNIGVYLPAGYDQGEQRYPVLYFLHGLWGTSRKWEERGTPATLDALIAKGKVPPMIVVCPDGKNSMYMDALEIDAPWGEFLASELVETIDGKFRTRRERDQRAITGDSMGGYGAINTAFKHPDVFSAVSAHEAMLYPADPEKLPDRIKQFAPQWKPVYGWPIDAKHWKEWNPLEQAATLPVETLKQLAIYFDCGNQDRFGFNATNEQLHQLLEERKVPHEWFLRDGGHGRDYFSEYVGESLQFHGRRFAAAAEAAAKRDDARIDPKRGGADAAPTKH